jgi:hypothetical protein
MFSVRISPRLWPEIPSVHRDHPVGLKGLAVERSMFLIEKHSDGTQQLVDATTGF